MAAEDKEFQKRKGGLSESIMTDRGRMSQAHGNVAVHSSQQRLPVRFRVPKGVYV